MTTAVFAFADSAGQARRLADQCGVSCHLVEVRRFPDGESLVRVPGGADTALLVRSLDDPNAKLVELLLAASALRDRGSARVMLVAPYLAYMRQDIAFREGEAVSQRVIGALLAAHFDGVATVDPHLHRIARLDQAIPGVPALAVSAAPALAEAIRAEVAADAILIGPDIEARPWVSSIAGPLGLDMLVGEKVRHGDREVALTIPGIAAVSGRDAVLVDDMVSSGTTLIACARLLRAAGARSISAVTTHALASAADIERMRAEGIVSLRAADSTASPVATISLASVLAAAIRAQGWLDGAGEDPASR